MSDSARCDENNEVYLYDNATIQIAGNLTATSPVATIEPKSYSAGNQVLRAADGSGIAITTDICKQFALSPDLDGGDWEILPNDTGESGILKTTSFYVRGTGGSWFSSSGFTEQGSDTTGFGTREKPFATIQKAIDAVVLDANDETSEYTIYVDGTFTASSADIANFSALSKALTVKIVGLNKSDKAVLDGNNAARVIVAGDDSTAINISLTLENLIIQNGNSTARGAGVTLCAGAGNSHTIKNCEIKGNNADYGAAIYNKYSPLHLVGCTISDNITTTSGTVYNGGSADAILTMSDVSITNNTAGNGGGIFIGGDGSSQNGASTVRISDSSVIISGNTSTKKTGAGICIWQGKLELSGSAKIDDNIYLRNDKQHITITGALSQSNVADIYANDVSAQTVILDGASSLVSSHYNQFTLTNSGWEIGQDGYMRKK